LAYLHRHLLQDAIQLAVAIFVAQVRQCQQQMPDGGRLAGLQAVRVGAAVGGEEGDALLVRDMADAEDGLGDAAAPQSRRSGW